MSVPGCLVVFVRSDDEPAAHWPLVSTSVRALFEALGDEPKRIWATTPAGRSGRERAFSWPTMDSLAADTNTGTVSTMGLRERPNAMDLSLYLRHNPTLRVRRQGPAGLWAAVELSRDWPNVERFADAARAFLRECARGLAVVHGGVTVLENQWQAVGEVAGTWIEVEKQPERFQRRMEGDRIAKATRLRDRCPRLYWTTLLGPGLAAAAGGAEAARIAGGRDVREVAGSLVFQATDGPPQDSLDPEFLAATAKLRRWLWPHTFQNPLDAAGFEDEVGAPRPTV